MGGDPVGVVGTGGGNSGIRRGNIEVSLLDGDTGLLRLAATSLLGEVGGDPDGVEEVEDTSEKGKDEEVEEDAGSSQFLYDRFSRDEENIHLRVEDAGLGLNHADGSIESLDSVELGDVLADNGDQVQPEVLRMHFSRETVWQGLSLPSWDLDSIVCRGKIADVCRRFIQSRQASSHEVDGDGDLFVVGES